MSEDLMFFDYTEPIFSNIYLDPTYGAVSVPNYVVAYMNTLESPYDTYKMIRESGTCSSPGTKQRPKNITSFVDIGNRIHTHIYSNELRQSRRQSY